MPKLLQICVEGNRGSTGRIANTIGDFVMQHGWESIICFARFPRPSKSTLIRIGSKLEILLHGLETRFFDRQGLGSRMATRRLIKQISKINPDIIQLHHLHGYYINIEILFDYLKVKNIPVIWIFHDCWSITGHCTHFDFIGCEKWMTECSKCPQLQEYPASYFLDRSTQNFRLKKKLFNQVNNLTIVNVSQWMNNVVGKSFLSSVKRKIIYNGIDTLIFRDKGNGLAIRNKYKLIGKFIILGVASPWSTKKGINDFLALSRIIDNSCKIVLIGLKKNEIDNLPENVIGITHLDSADEMASMYSMVDVFFSLSVEETFGLTVVEALSTGTPVLVYNCTASPELVDSKTGFVVEKGDYDGMLDAINGIKKNTKKFYSENCRLRVLNYFDKNKMLENYFSLYKSVLHS